MFLSLPNELILEVVENFTDTTDVFYLLMTNRHLSTLLQPVLIKASEKIIASAEETDLPLLHYAALFNNRSFAKLALKLDPGCLNQYTDRDGTPIHLAVFEGYESMVEFLLDRGADPNGVDPNAPPGTSPITPLHLALENIADVEIFEAHSKVDEGVMTLLLRRGADPNVVNENGMNALLHAARLGLPSIVAAILDTGRMDIDSRSITGSTALHIAVGRSEPSGVPELLLARGIDVNATNSFGQTALFHARRPSDTALLLKYGASAGVVDHSRRTVLHYLAHCLDAPHSLSNAKQILAAGGATDVGLRDINHRTAMDIAKDRGNAEFVNLLAKYQ